MLGNWCMAEPARVRSELDDLIREVSAVRASDER
jgi:hypothetical protein